MSKKIRQLFQWGGLKKDIVANNTKGDPRDEDFSHGSLGDKTLSF